MSGRSSSRYLGAAARATGGGRLSRAGLRHPVAWRRGAGRRSRAARRRHRAVRPGGRRGGGRGAGAARAGPGPDHLRHGRHLHRHRAGAGRRGRARPRAHAWRGERIALESLDIVTLGAGGGSIGACRRRRHAAGRPAQRRRGARPGLLRPGRHRADGDRRQPRARLSRSRTTSSAARASSTATARARPSDGSARALGLDAMAAAEGVHRLANVAHGRWHPRRDRAPRRRSARLHAARLRRRGRAACQRRWRANSA